MRAVVDTSALICILLREAERPAFIEVLLTNQVFMSAATLVECRRVSFQAGGDRMLAELQALIEDFGITIVSLNAAQADLARDGMLRFGKGRREPPAVLNFGDLFSYALARALDVPLLFKGDDFGRTDVRCWA